ncbi:hypothetical protein IC607_04645 [Cellulomonas sp. JH27-2]|uniref:DUF6049 family protein n=1 Tax=Cellulomonas sp. JH27-2 TaxID=2774139 RepID=UPI0017867DAB|nr:DUF6049 family protein [Cellulomonas sp. JH27-2]MBD8058258.1 hypothetical protein [Cellulomonas sp. JH27-2]
MSGRLAQRAVSATLALLAAVVAVPVGLAGQASAAVDETTLPVRVEITAVSPTVLRPGEDLTVRATLHNDGTTELEHVAADVRINAFRVGTRDAVAEWAGRGADDAAGDVEATTTVDDPLAPGDAVAVELTVPAAKIPLYNLPGVWGPRGLAVEATDSGRRVGLERSFVLWYPEESVTPVPVSVLLPFAGPADDPSSTTADTELDAQTAPTGALGQMLAAAQADNDVGLVVDPSLVTRARAGDEQSQTWANQLTAAVNAHDTFTLPWADPDVAALGHADHADLLKVAVDASRTSDAIGTGRPTIVWSAADQTLDQATAGAAAAARVSAVVARTPAAGAASSVTHSTVSTDDGELDRFTPDGTLSSMLVDPTAVEPGATSATITQRALAELAVIAREDEDDPQPVLLAPGRDEVADPQAVRTLMAAFRSAPWARVDDVSTLLIGSASDAKALPEDQTDDSEVSPAAVTALADARQHAIDFSAVTPQPDALLEGVDDETLAPLSIAWRSDAAGRAQVVERSVGSITARTVGLTVAPLSTVNVLGATGTIRPVVRNDLDVPATVQLVITPRKACLQVLPIDPITIDANSSDSVLVDLRATANCEVAITAYLESTDGARVSPVRAFDARVAPTIESVGTYVVAGLLAIGLILGIVRTVRRGQSARRGARTEAETGPAPSLPVLGGTPDEDAGP